MNAHPPHHAAVPAERVPGPVRDAGGRRSVTVGVLVGLAAVLLLLAVGMVATQVPGLGQAGAYVSAWAVWVVVAGFAVAAAGSVALLRRGTLTRLAVTAVGLVVVAISFTVLTQQLRVAQEHGVGVRIAELFRVGRGDVAPDQDDTYGDHDGEAQGMSIWLPDGADRGSQDGAPVVVLVHGGGWVAGERSQTTTASHAAWFASQGYLALSVDYPLSTTTEHRWDVVEPQVACALAWAGAHAADHGGDASHVFLVGDSAGGNIALDVAYRTASGTLEAACGGEVPPVAAVSTLYPVANPIDFHDNPDLLLGDRSRSMIERYTGGTPDEVPERYAAVWPAEHVSAAAPPTLMVLGTADHMVPTTGADDLVDVLRANAVTHDLVRIPHGEHVFDAAPGGVGTQVWRELTLRLFTAAG
ncbi:alpha/beta hydrolase [Isoptericola jiangsuensis]|uniref:alpha/beta hydrolase n=1 Tax=Isoptericola jiangsuensis TaxID=548579 RepID=UPI003AAECC8A